MNKKEIAKQWYSDYKKTLVCAHCPETRPICLDFHHFHPSTKKAAVSALVSAGASVDEIKAEIAKCLVLCVSCHRALHQERAAEAKRVRLSL